MAPTGSLLATALLALAAALSGAAGESSFQDLVAVDCQGAVRAFPSNDLAGSVVHTPMVRRAFDYLAAKVLDKAACHCPEASEEDLTRAFGLSVGNVLYHAANWEGPDDPVAPSAALEECGFSVTMHDMFSSFFGLFELPSTCTPESYAETGSCKIRANTTGDGLQLLFAASRCEGTDFPAVSLSCAGDLCDAFLRPCSLDSDCTGGVACQSLGGLSVADTLLPSLADLLGLSNVYPDDEPCAGTTQSDAAVTTLTNIQELLAQYLGSSSAPSAAFKFCGVQTVLGPSSADARSVPRRLFQPCGPGAEACNSTTGVTAWDGTLPDGTSAVSSARLDGTAWPRLPREGVAAAASGPVDRHLLELSCETRLSVLRGSPMELSVSNPNVHALLGALQADVITPLMECRPGAPAALSPQYQVFHNFLSPEFWLKIATSERTADATASPAGVATVRDAMNANETTTGDVVNGLVSAYNELLTGLDTVRRFVGLEFGGSTNCARDERCWRDLALGRIRASADEVLELDALAPSCSLAKLDEDGICSVRWDGLGNITGGLDAALTLALARCGDAGAGAGAPSLSIGCVGDGCAEIFDSWQATTCADDSDCDGGLPCERTGATAPLLGDFLWDATASESLFGPVNVTSVEYVIYHDVSDDGGLQDAALASLLEWRRANMWPENNTEPAFHLATFYSPETLTGCVEGDTVSATTLFVVMDTASFNGTALEAFLGSGLAGFSYGPGTECNGTNVAYSRFAPDGPSTSEYYNVQRCPSDDYYTGDVDGCPGDVCASRELAGGEAIEALRAITGQSTSGNLTGLGVCRPAWVDAALQFDFDAFWPTQVSRDGAGTISVTELASFCDNCTSESGTGGGGGGGGWAAATAAAVVAMAAAARA